jgi:hypothetical protein
MTLAALIRKRATGKPANDNTAKVANDGLAGESLLVGLAALALADFSEEKTANPLHNVGKGDPAAAYRWWRIHFSDREPLEVICSPPATYAEIRDERPDAIRVEPFEPIRWQPTTPLSAADEIAIRAWLAYIDETDVATIDEVLKKCCVNTNDRKVLLQWAEKLPQPTTSYDDRRHCDQ